MMHPIAPHVTRRQFLSTTSAAALAAGVGAHVLVPGRASAQQKTLKILSWKHFMPAAVTWFDTYVKAWGEEHDTKVIVEWIPAKDIPARAAAEAKAQRGHDLVISSRPVGAFEDQAIDHREIYQACEATYGKALEVALKTTYNPKTKKFYSFCDSYAAQLTNYRTDLWEAVGTRPDTWDNVLSGGRKIKLLEEKPVGFGLGGDGDGKVVLWGLLFSFGALVQNADHQPALKSKVTLDALKFIKTLYEQAMTEEVLTWNTASDNRAMLEGTASLVFNPLSITRTAENKQLAVGQHIGLAPVPQGSVSRLSPPAVFQNNLIWTFADNGDGARQFLVDYVGQSRQAFLASQFYHVPCFPHTVPDLPELVARDQKATPPDTYTVLAEAGAWTTNRGYPGYTNAAIAEVYNAGLVSKMFAQVATGQLTPEDALAQADAQVQRIFAQWRERGKI